MPASRVQLDWTAPPECPSGQEVLSEVERLLALEGRDRDPIQVRATVVSSSPDRWTAEVHIARSGGVSTRRLDAESCQAAADAVAFVIALAADPGPEELAKSSRERNPPRSKRHPHETRGAKPSPALRLEVGAGPTVDVYVFPRAAWGAESFAALRFGATRFELAARYLLPQTFPIGDHPTARATLDLGSLRVQGSYGWTLSSLEVAPTAGFEIGRFHSESEGVEHPGEGDALRVATSAGMAMDWPSSSWLGVRIAGSVVVPLLRSTFVVEGIERPVHRTEAVSARAQVSARIQW